TVGLLVVASDRGLCGAYNSSILKTAWKRKQEIEKEPGTQVKCYFVGRRANEFFAKRGIVGHFFKDVWAGRFTVQKSDEVAKYFVDEFLTGKIDRLEACFTEFKSAIQQIPQSKTLLPLPIDTTVLSEPTKATPVVAAGAGENVGFIYKPGREELLNKLLP